MSGVPPPADDVVGAPSAPSFVERSQEYTRSIIALILVLLFCGEVTVAFLALFRKIEVANIKDVFELVIGPTVALVGSVIGFYFGTKSRSDE